MAVVDRVINHCDNSLLCKEADQKNRFIFLIISQIDIKLPECTLNTNKYFIYGLL